MKSKIYSVNAFAKIRPRLKKKKLVFTNGCFDLLHRGHVQYLQKAKNSGDLLIVALNSDASVQTLNKGPNRPIQPLADRLEIMAALECVDYVTWFHDETPLNAILKIKPQLLVKGGDWKASEIVGAKEVLSWGGKVKTLKFLKGRSTTSLIKKSKSR